MHGRLISDEPESGRRVGHIELGQTSIEDDVKANKVKLWCLV
jgi:hypothetical protein